jgi:hypothetical protein
MDLILQYSLKHIAVYERRYSTPPGREDDESPSKVMSPTIANARISQILRPLEV